MMINKKFIPTILFLLGSLPYYLFATSDKYWSGYYFLLSLSYSINIIWNPVKTILEKKILTSLFFSCIIFAVLKYFLKIDLERYWVILMTISCIIFYFILRKK